MLVINFIIILIAIVNRLPTLNALPRLCNLKKFNNYVVQLIVNILIFC